MLDLTAIAWTVVAFCALLVGFTKTGLPMAGIVVVPLLAVVMDAQLSVGFLLGCYVWPTLWPRFTGGIMPNGTSLCGLCPQPFWGSLWATFATGKYAYPTATPSLCQLSVCWCLCFWPSPPGIIQGVVSKPIYLPLGISLV